MHVDRCICHEKTLAELKAMAQAEGLDAEGLRRRTGCGSSCGLCFPYVRLMLATGETRIPVSTPDEIERRIWQASRRDGSTNTGFTEPRP